jgi:hypothetical protein
MTTRAELLEALAVERYTSPWWVTPPTVQAPDDDLTCARRRRELAADFDALSQPERKAT